MKGGHFYEGNFSYYVYQQEEIWIFLQLVIFIQWD